MGKNQYRLAEDTELLHALVADNALKEHAGNFLLYGGVMAGHADGQLGEEEIAYLADALSPIFEDARGIILSIDSPEYALQFLEASIVWLRGNAGLVRNDLIRCLSGIAAADDVLDPDERRFVQNMAERLGVPSQVALEILEGAFLEDPFGLD